MFFFSETLWELNQGYTIIVEKPISASLPVINAAALYLQVESDDFETLLHCIKLLLVEGVAHDVRP